MISVRDAEAIHAILIENFGGSKGIRDLALLESALSRPYQTFDQKDLYPTSIDKAAALFESLIINHPFIDGNKRIAYVLMRLTLLESGLHILGTQTAKYDFVIETSKGNIRFDQIREWLIKFTK